MKLQNYRVVRRIMAVFATIAVASTAHAQVASPRPYVDVRQLPEAWRDALPADFNGDGRTDLIARRDPSASVTGVAVWLGHGDGTFGSSIGIGRDARVLATGRFNGDLYYDAVVQDV